MPTLAGIEQRFHPTLPSEDAPFPSFDRKMDGPNPSEMDIKMSIPAPTFCLQSKKVYFKNGRRKNISLVRKSEIKNTKCMTLNMRIK